MAIVSGRRRLGAQTVIAGAVLGLAACATGPEHPDKNQVISHSLKSTVQLFVAREDGVRRAGSGVVVFVGGEGARTLVVTTSHLLAPPVDQSVEVIRPPAVEPVPGDILALDEDIDLALIELSDPQLAPVTLKSQVALGDDIWVVAFPWGRQRTVVNGVVSQVAWDEPVGPDAPIYGPANLIDASVSYGMSGGGVFDRWTGELIGIVRGYRSANLSLPGSGADPLKIPVAGETTVISAAEIACFLGRAGVDEPIAHATDAACRQ